ncbi:hypothetical protein [Paraglaciecola hydrolytica]|uniref:Sugar transporter n=1 Tax=Paraglaciecola hydrolytica TaxID=1799789 RepID=A0A148KLL1_9ALTE|nr:hypothetical protein [Paraglaciecola hydrolytica]KXI27125.1 hypothetical protein AX660_01695 [Paraglaciecola hydrolytica]
MPNTKQTTTEQTPQIAGWFKPVAIVLLIWNLLGLLAFIQHLMLTPEHIAALPVAEQALYQNNPLWITIAFACAVFGGVLGCLALVLKKAWAIPLLWLSLLGVLAQNFHSFFMSEVLEVYGVTALIMPTLVILISIYLCYLSHSAVKRQWLN